MAPKKPAGDSPGFDNRQERRLGVENYSPAARRQRRQQIPPDTLHLEDVPTVAARLSVTEKDIWRRIARGQLFSVKLGKRRLIPSTEVDRVIHEAIAAAQEGRSA